MKKILGLLSVIVFSVILVSHYASAATNNTPQAGNSGLQISPTRTDLALNPGNSTTFKITVKNVTAIPLVAKAFINDFESDNESGTPKLIVNSNQHSPRSIQSFLSGLSDIALNPGESKNVNLTVRIPANASPGGYYGAIRYAAVPQNAAQNSAERQISLTASVASLALIEVNGPVTESLNFQSLKVLRSSDPGTFFFGKAPDHVAIRLSNGGNGFSQPIGRVTVNKGKKQVYSYEFNSTSAGLHSTILPNSTRTFTDPIKNVSAFGQYKVMASLAYKQGGATITVSKTFWVIPRSIQIGLLSIIALALILWGLWKLAENRGRRRR